METRKPSEILNEKFEQMRSEGLKTVHISLNLNNNLKELDYEQICQEILNMLDGKEIDVEEEL